MLLAFEVPPFLRHVVNFLVGNVTCGSPVLSAVAPVGVPAPLVAFCKRQKREVDTAVCSAHTSCGKHDRFLRFSKVSPDTSLGPNALVHSVCPVGTGCGMPSHGSHTLGGLTIQGFAVSPSAKTLLASVLDSRKGPI